MGRRAHLGTQSASPASARRDGEGDALRRLLGPRAHGGSRLQDRQARHHAYAPGPFPLRQEPRDLRLQLAALSRAVSENRLDERLKIYTVAAAVDRRRDLLPADRSHFPETSIPHK